MVPLRPEELLLDVDVPDNQSDREKRGCPPTRQGPAPRTPCFLLPMIMGAMTTTAATTPAPRASGSTRNGSAAGVPPTWAGEENCELDGLKGAILLGCAEAVACCEESVELFVTV